MPSAHSMNARSQRRCLYVVVGPDPQSAKWSHHNRRETSETTPHLKPIPPSHLTFTLQLHRVSRFPNVCSTETVSMNQWTSDCVLNVYCPLAAAPPPIAKTCHTSHFSQMFEDVQAELKRQ